MAPGKPVRLLKLVEREFRVLTGEHERTPPPPWFKGPQDQPCAV